MWKHVQEIESQFRQAVVGLLYFEWLNCFREPISISKFTYSLGVALSVVIVACGRRGSVKIGGHGVGSVLADVNVLAAAAWARRGRERKKRPPWPRQRQPSGTGLICSRAGTVLATGRLTRREGMAAAHKSSCRPSITMGVGHPRSEP